MIRSELDVLLDKVEDQALRADLRTQIDRLKQKRSFGLVFEQHIPERVRLPHHPIRVGSQVVSLEDDDSPTWEVVAIDDGVATLLQVRDPDGGYLQRSEHAGNGEERTPLDSLVVISDFGEPVLPGLRHLGSIDRGGDKPYHVVIKGENHHVLEALRFTHAGKVDCIYIDPPYNSGARDWKYNNDYVDDNDAYRHSKWLAFMERRLKLAKDLLNPNDSVLIVTIDEREHLRLGLLLEQLFAGCDVQMVTSVINPSGAVRLQGYARVEEYLFFVSLGGSSVVRSTQDMLTADAGAKSLTLWRNLIRDSGSTNLRQDRWAQFYPIFVDIDGRRIVGSGHPLPLGTDRRVVEAPSGTVAVFPLRISGDEGYWQLGQSTFELYRERGYVRVGQVRGDRISLNYIRGGDVRRIESGEIAVLGRSDTGELILDEEHFDRPQVPKSVWNMPSHAAPIHGSTLLRALIPGRRFPYPKSLYAVEDSLRFYVGSKPNAVIVDFFAGSGTTAHAVARLNRQDGGLRQSIMVTNNEVSVDESMELKSRGLRPG